jgi:hypothetical protein
VSQLNFLFPSLLVSFLSAVSNMTEVFDCPTVLRASRDLDTGAFRDEGFHCVCGGVLLLNRSQMAISIVEKEDFCETGVSSNVQLRIELTSVSKVNFRVLRSRRRNFEAGRIRLLVVVDPTRGEEQITIKLAINDYERLQKAIFALLDHH